MIIKTTYKIWPRDLDFEKLFSVVEAFASERKMKRGVISRFTVERDPFETVTAHSLEELDRCLSRRQSSSTYTLVKVLRKEAWY